MKLCSKCGIEKDESEFYKCKTNRDGLQTKCKECLKSYQEYHRVEKLLYLREYSKKKTEERQQKKKERVDDLLKRNVKVCSKCKNEKDISFFTLDRSTSDKLSVYCKECRKELRHEVYIKNKDLISIRIKNYHESHKENILKYWRDRSKNRSQYKNGILNINTNTGIGVVTEHVVETVLGDCINLNKDNFHSSYDLISKKYGTINVKSSLLRHYKKRKSTRWYFIKKEVSKIPDIYICIGFDENKTEIQHVWMIPGNSTIVSKTGISISNSFMGLNSVKMYEVDNTLYNDLYIKLNLNTLDEFRNAACDEKNEDICK